MRKALLSVLLIFAVSGPAVAGPFEDGQAAHARGDYATALSLWRPLAEQGHAFAQTNLGVMYARGQGVIQDNVYAYMWGNISASNGNEIGGKLRDMVARKMTPAQIADAQKLTRECIRKKYKGC